MARRSHRDDVEALLAEQIAYYRARAPEYAETTLIDLPEGDLTLATEKAIARLAGSGLHGDVLELACGPGTWTGELLRHADAVTAIDSSPEMLALAAEKLRDDRVTFIEADLFSWEPDRRHDAVFFGFWLSHVPLERFEAFWSLVERALKPGGRVAFVDDAYRTADELVDGDDSSTVRRRLLDGSTYHAVKVPHTTESLQRRIEALGWEVEVTELAGPFFWGQAATRDSPRIETDRLILTPMTVGDVEAYLELHSDPDVIRFLGEMDRSLAVARLESDARLWADRGHGLFKLTHRDDGRFLGRVGLRYWPQFDETEVGWTLRREEWGYGFATEAARAVAAWGLRQLPVPYLTSYIEPHNARSIAVAERLGMTPLREDALDGIPTIGNQVLNGIRIVVYAVTREEWVRRVAV